MNDVVKLVLIRAREIISEASHWTKGASARNKYGEEIFCDEPTAYCFCSLGAIYRARYDISTNSIITLAAVDKLRKSIRTEEIAYWNDSSTHAEVLAGFDKAISEC